MEKSRIVITDVGSTTTKAIFLQEAFGVYSLKALSNAITTVERPYEDVKIGVFQAIRQLEKDIGEQLLTENATELNLKFLPDVAYYTTSSAGGGLQILVIGLTLFDSAKSAERAAFGAGGVLLNTLAINDLRSTYEQLQLINNSHPDIILFSGGTDGGAFTGVIRLAEILSLGKPSPKFETENKIPLVYAGNVEAQEFIKDLFVDNYDLSILPNIRPTMEHEVLEPITDKIHELFLNSVMENAPGYAQLKQVTDAPILPTPLAVLKAMELIKDRYNSCMLKVDIGGATTDIFSVINDNLYRTVSANYGMSYSIANVLANAGWKELKDLLPNHLSEDLVRNYIGNKMLNPGHVPNSDIELVIEHAIAVLALRLSLQQHYEMHLNTTQIGFLEHVKSRFRDPFYDQMYQEKVAEAKQFHHSDINVVIGAGGVISHTQKPLQAFYIILQGFQVEGITQIWRDKHFISPHLGAFIRHNKEQAYKLLLNECYENLGTVISPFIQTTKPNRDVMSVTVGTDIYTFKINEVKYIPLKEKQKVTVKLTKHALIKDVDEETSFETDKPILITTYPNKQIDNNTLIKELNLYDLTNLKSIEMDNHIAQTINKKETGTFTKEIRLPYDGNILVSPDDKLEPDAVYGVNNHSFPKIYIISLAKLLGKNYKTISIRDNLLVRVGDLVKFGQRLIDVAQSPVRGVIKNINYKTGTLIVSELQDYHEKPKIIPVAKMVNKKPKSLNNLLRVQLGDFVFEDENIVHITRAAGGIVKAPNTGYVTNIDTSRGEVTIQYKRTPVNYQVGFTCRVVSIEDRKSVTIEYEATEYKGVIGFGKSNFGKLIYLSNLNDGSDLTHKIVVYNGAVTQQDLEFLATKKISGLIIAGINMKAVVQFIGKEIGVALTGNEDVPYPLILMNGFGDYKLSAEFVETVKKNEGHNCYLNPATQIRAGVTRPKISIN